MSFQVGDQVVHWQYGTGEVIKVEEKELFGELNHYYVVQTRDLTIWVPMDGEGSSCLRPPTPEQDFENLFDILSSEGSPLSPDRFERKTQLVEGLKDGSLESVCKVIRDLMTHNQTSKMNDHDHLMLERARKFLLNEWSISLSIPFEQAAYELDELLPVSTAPKGSGR